MSESSSANTTSSSAGQASGRRGRIFFVTLVEKYLATVESEDKKMEVESDALKWLSPLIKQSDAISEPPERESRRKVGYNLGTDLGSYSYALFYTRSIHNKKRVCELEFEFLEKVRELVVNANSNSGAFVSMKNSNKEKVIKQWLDDCEQPPFPTQNPASVARVEAIEFSLDSDIQHAQSPQSEAVTSATNAQN